MVFSPVQIGQAIEQASPELPTRKAGHEADYVARTVKAVMASPKVASGSRSKPRSPAQQQAREDSGPSLGM